MYLRLLKATNEKYPFTLHAYCLMTNHIHLLLETKESPTKDIMRYLHSRYATYFNQRHDLVGHVFQGRYHAEFIDSATYFIEVSRYIHLNPVKSNLVDKPEHYSWSSYNAYCEKDFNNLPFLSTNRVLSFFEFSSTGAANAYSDFINAKDDWVQDSAQNN